LDPNNPTGLRDPVLYRCFYLVLWRSRQDAKASREEIDAAARIMRGQLGWCPKSVQLPTREVLSYQPTILWGRDSGHRSKIDGHSDKFTNRFALAHHEDLIVLQGLEQEGAISSSWQDWLTQVRSEWDMLVGPANWESHVRYAKDITNAGSPVGQPLLPLLGHCWIATCEWDASPALGWQEFGRRSFRPGSYVAWTWGLLKFDAGGPGADGSPTFELHTTREQADQRNEFLFTSLTVMTLSYVKLTQYLAPKFRTIAEELNRQEEGLLDAVEATDRLVPANSLRDTEAHVRLITERLLHFNRSYTRAADLAHSAGIARDAVVGILGQGDRALQPAELIQAVELLPMQIRSDLLYYQDSGESARRALESMRTLVEVEQTKTEQRLTLVAVALGTALSLGQIVGADRIWDWSVWLRGLAFLLVGAVIAPVVLVCLKYWRN
jgi:hypothetical protein